MSAIRVRVCTKLSKMVLIFLPAEGLFGVVPWLENEKELIFEKKNNFPKLYLFSDIGALFQVPNNHTCTV